MRKKIDPDNPISEVCYILVFTSLYSTFSKFLSLVSFGLGFISFGIDLK